VTWQKKAVFLTPTQAVKRLEKYCAYQERSQLQVQKKCRELGLTQTETGELLIHLIQGNFLNELRFAEAYVRGKSKIKGWGRDKIYQGLKQAGIPEKLCLQVLGGIQEDLEIQHITKWATKKLKALRYNEDEIQHIIAGKLPLNYENKQKLRQFLFTKGYPLEQQKEVLRFL
jgi:regulatory protein